MENANIVTSYTKGEGKLFICSNSFVDTEEEKKKTIQKIQLCANKILDNILAKNTDIKEKGIE